MASGVIEIDISAPWEEPEAVRPPSRRALLVGLVVLAILLGLTGPTVLLPASLRLTWRASTLSGFFWLSPDALYTVDHNRSGSPGLQLVSRELRSGTVRWRAELTGPLADVYAVGGAGLASRFPPGPTLGARTIVVDAYSGRVVRAYPVPAMPLVHLARDVAVSIDRDPTSGNAPVAEFRGRSTGLEWSHRVTARDLRTGAVRWSRPIAAGVSWSVPGVRSGTEGIVGVPAGQDWMLTASAAGTVEVWDLRTGAVVSRRDLGRLEPRSYVLAMGDAVLIGVDSGEAADLAAFEPSTFAPRWRFSAPDLAAEPLACAPMVCLESTRLVRVIDPATGSVLWQNRGSTLRPAVQPGLLLVTTSGERLALFEPATGRAVRVKGQWRMVDTAGYRPQAVVAQGEGESADVGVLALATGTIRRLGSVDPWSLATRCLATQDHLACEDDDTVRVWRSSGGP